MPSATTPLPSQLEPLRRRLRHLVHRLLEGQQLVGADVLADDPRERSGPPRMLLSRQRDAVRADHREGRGDHPRDVLLGHHVEHDRDLRLLGEQELGDEADRVDAVRRGQVGDRAALELGMTRRSGDDDVAPAVGLDELLPAGKAVLEVAADAVELLRRARVARAATAMPPSFAHGGISAASTVLPAVYG